jgi:hypothetical protein
MVLLFTVVADMVLKPDLGDWPVLLVMVIVLAAAGAVFLSPVMRTAKAPA